MAISAQEHTRQLTRKVVGTFYDEKPVMTGFGNFFPRETAPTLLVDLEVQRNNDLIAVDVQRFTEGRGNKFSLLTEKKFQPPFYDERYDLQRDQVYMNTIALGVGLENDQTNRAIAQNTLKNLRIMRNKVERAINKQQVEALVSGIVELKSGDSIDFKRKSISMETVSTAWSDNANADIKGDIKKGAEFIREEGNSGSKTINLVMRGTALNNLLNNAALKDELNNRRIDRGNIEAPNFDATTGFAFHGQISAGDFQVNLWTYNQKYTDDQGSTKYYLEEDKVVFLPDDFEGKTVFGGLPNMVDRNINGQNTRMPSIEEAEYLVRAFSDDKTTSSTLSLSSAPLAIPFSVDRIYTLKTTV